VKLPRPRNLRSFKDMSKTAVGLASIGLIAGACVATFAVGQLGLLQDRYTMSGVFSDTGGLRSGDAVRVAGVDVGTITGVHPDFEHGYVVIDWEVDRDVDLGRDTTAEIALGTLLGGEHLRLSSDPSEPYLSELPAEERRIPLERTSVPISVTEALGDTTRVVQQVDTDQVNDVIAAFGDIATETEDVAGQLFTHLDQVASAITAREADVHRLVDSSRTVTATLADRDQQLVALIDSAGVLLDEIARRRDELAAVLGDGSAAVQALTGVIADHRASLEAVLGDLHVAIEAAGRQIGPLNDALAWMGPTFSGISRAGAHGPWIDVVFEGLGPDAIGVVREMIEDAAVDQGLTG
jgi:phospholipid/cholesterol/gamma-HCH transport system substrate-binding protein